MSAAADFAATRWTLVLKARAGAADPGAALSELCAAYYEPVRTFIRAQVRDPESARDLTQEFFARVLRGGAFDRAEPERGRFRSFVLGAVKHFLADTRDRERAAKRGGGSPHEPLEPGTATSPGLDPPDLARLAPDVLFDRNWALALLDRALVSLAAEMAAGGKAAHFDTLKPWLTGDAAGLSQAEAAAQLGMNEGAVKVAVHRLRRRFREAVKTEIAQTLADAREVETELRHLLAAISA